MRAITLTWISIAWLLSSIPAWGQQLVDVAEDQSANSFRFDINIGFRVYVHPAILTPDPDVGGFSVSSYFEACNICTPSGAAVPGAGYQLRIFSKHQDPTKGDLFDKPILVTQGFDPNFHIAGKQFDYKEFESLLSSVYDPKDGHLVCDEVGFEFAMFRPGFSDRECNETNLLRQLYSEGYDIALLLWENPLIDIETNARVTLQALRWLQEYTNKSEGSEPVVIGPSLGGLVTRYALQLAGDQRAIGTGATLTHGPFAPEIIRARLFIAFDSPNRGAEIPMSLQAFVNYFSTDDTELKQIFLNLTSVAARQLLLSSVKDDQDTGDACQIIVDYEDPAPTTIGDCVTGNDHAIFMQKINWSAFREQIKGIVHPSAGIMQPIHTAAIINGSGIGMTVGYTTQARLYATQDHTSTVHLDLRSGSSSMLPPVQVFNGDIAPHFGTLLSCIFADCDDDKDSFRYFFQEPAWVENAPGGLRNTFAFIVDKVQEKSSWDEVDAQYTNTTHPFGNHAFIPTLSSLGLLDRDINDNASWFVPFMDPSRRLDPFTGIVGVETRRPCNGQCMFDEVFAPKYNQRHVAVTTQNKQWFLDLIHTYGPRIPGDLDNDNDIDRDDLNILLQDLGKSVSQSACGASCDLNGDGYITNLDAHQLIQLCSRPQCATQ